MKLTNAELAVLGLIAEKPRHGYDLERVVQERGMRNWTELAFSSIYYVLKKLAERGLVASDSARQPGQRSRKTFSATRPGRRQLRDATIQALALPHPVYPSILLGLANWPTVDPDTAVDALNSRCKTLSETIERLSAEKRSQAPLPPFVEAIFDYSLSQMQAEIAWLRDTIRKFGGRDGED